MTFTTHRGRKAVLIVQNDPLLLLAEDFFWGGDKIKNKKRVK
jgi:hypothetical protein